MVEDLSSIRYKVWGKVKRSLGGVALSTRADVASDDKERIDLDLSLDSDIVDIHVAATASTSLNQLLLHCSFVLLHIVCSHNISRSGIATNKTIDFKNVQLKKGFGLFGGRLTVNPRYNLKSFTGDVKLSYEMEKTTFDVKAFGDDQQLTVSRVVGENTIVAPSISTSGDFSLAVQQQTDIGKITGTLKSNDSLSLQWEDGTWVATAVAPIEGYRYNGVKMSVKKLVEFD